MCTTHSCTQTKLDSIHSIAPIWFLNHHDVLTLYKIMNQELKKVTAWLTANKLSLNINKTNFIIFKSNRKKLKNKANVIINEHTIDQVKYTKFLGIYINEELSWKYHICNNNTDIRYMFE